MLLKKREAPGRGAIIYKWNDILSIGALNNQYPLPFTLSPPYLDCHRNLSLSSTPPHFFSIKINITAMSLRHNGLTVFFHFLGRTSLTNCVCAKMSILGFMSHSTARVYMAAILITDEV